MKLKLALYMDRDALRELTRIGDNLMALKDELQALNQKLTAATDNVAAEIARLTTNSLTNAEKTAIEAAAQAQIDRLTALVPPLVP